MDYGVLGVHGQIALKLAVLGSKSRYKTYVVFKEGGFLCD